MDWTEQEVGKMKGFVKSNPKLNPGLQNMNSNLRDMQVKIPPRPPIIPDLLPGYNSSGGEEKNMIKRIFLLLIIAGLCGCGSIEREKARYTGSSSMCIGGVEYIQFTSGASVAYTPDGKIKTCK